MFLRSDMEAPVPKDKTCQHREDLFGRFMGKPLVNIQSKRGKVFIDADFLAKSILTDQEKSRLLEEISSAFISRVVVVVVVRFGGRRRWCLSMAVD